jgi:L-lactate dehydrogenase complex protein LldG
MTNIEQTRFIGKIKTALGRSDSDHRRLKDLIPTSPDADDLALIQATQGRDREMRLALLDRMTKVAKTINTKVVAAETEAEITAAIAKIAANSHAEWGDQKSIVAWDHPLVNCLDLSVVIQPLGVPVYFPEDDSHRQGAETFRRQSETALLGVTSADFGIAETATLAMKTRPGRPLHVSLLPSIHIAVIHLEQILYNLKELYTLLKWDSAQKAEGLTHSMSFITGPSKTADIEAILVHGAHGPRELVVFVLTKKIRS